MTTIILAVTQPVTVGAVVFLLTRYLTGRDEREALERQVLLQRIQAPEQAVVEHTQQTGVPDLPAVDPFDDDAHWEAQKQAIRDAEAAMTRFQREVTGAAA